MSVVLCRCCKNHYWRYRRDHPPAGYCSVPHAELGMKRKPGIAPRTPESIMREMRRHRIEIHGDPDPLEWWEDCAICDELEGAYAESLSYSALLQAAIEGPIARAG